MRIFMIALLALFVAISTEAVTIESPFLWKAQKGKDTVYLLGTIHIGVALSDLPEKVGRYMDDSEIVFLEVDPREETDFRVMMLPDGQNLEQLLGPKAWGVLVKVLGEENVDQMKYFKPWFVAGILIKTAIGRLLKGKGNISLEEDIASYAKKQGLKLDGLESPSEALAAVDAAVGYGVEDFRAELEEAADSPDDLLFVLGEEFLGLYDCYVLSDQECIENVVVKEGKKFNKELLVKRNNSWMGKILRELIVADTMFVAAGVAHFLGEENVLSLLEQEGFVITDL